MSYHKRWSRIVSIFRLQLSELKEILFWQHATGGLVSGLFCEDCLDKLYIHIKIVGNHPSMQSHIRQNSIYFWCPLTRVIIYIYSVPWGAYWCKYLSCGKVILYNLCSTAFPSFPNCITVPFTGYLFIRWLLWTI